MILRGHRSLPSRRLSRLAILLAVCSVLIAIVEPPCDAQNLSIRDVPLKPWMGSARSWDWTYDALHRLVLSGLAGRVVMNTKPMSRREMAIILADILRRIQNNQVSQFAHRTDLQETILALMEEFAPELRALGVTGYGIKQEVPRTLEIKPLEHLQFRAGFTSNSATNLENSNGERLDIGLNGRVTSSSWLEAGGIVAGYIQPEYEIGTETNRGQLIEGYVKARGGPVELIVGRESLWWGPGFHGSMLFSNNALAMDMIRLRTANQITLPWVFADLLGPMKFELFFGGLEKERAFYPRSKVTGARIDFAPTPWLEVGAARSIMFDGGGDRADLPWYRYPFVYVHGNKEGTEGDSSAGDNRWQIDASIRLADVGKYVPISQDAELYFDLGWDDTCCGTFYVPIFPGGIVGLYLPNLFLSPDTTFRIEFTNTTRIQFTQGTWQDGYQRKGQVISTFVGTKGQDLFVRLTQRLNPQIDVGIEFDWARIGQTQYGLAFGTKEKKLSFGVDVSYQHSPQLSLNFAGRLEWTNNLDFVPGRQEVNQIYTAAVTYAFEPTIGTGKRATVPPKDVPPVELPPGKPDPDQIASWDYAEKTVKDGWSLLTAPTRWDTKDWLVAGGVAAATGGAMLLDTQVRRTVQDHRTHGGDNAAQIVTNLGFIVPAAGAVTSYVLGEALGDEKAKQRAADAVEATIFSSALVFSMNFLTGRSKPEDNRGSQDYHPFNISGSLPSFHTAEAFAAAAVAAEHWDDPWVSALAYGLATSVGLSRIYLDKHWSSDVVLGAAIGTVVGKAVVAFNKNRRGSPVSVVPLVAPGSWGAALQYRY
jgi:Capsule assembly protein Wzi/PAP2 superfamily